MCPGKEPSSRSSEQTQVGQRAVFNTEVFGFMGVRVREENIKKAQEENRLGSKSDTSVNWHMAGGFQPRNKPAGLGCVHSQSLKVLDGLLGRKISVFPY